VTKLLIAVWRCKLSYAGQLLCAEFHQLKL